ncbi:MAG TPA: Ig-like domain-containing protein [Arachnia sp.]|nr:Ig-like domain-containing protein [Arachnia sp.]
MRSFVVRVLAIAALVLGSTLPFLPAQAAPDALEPAPTELTYACALKSNGLMRWVENLSSCTTKETRITVKPGPTRVCAQPSGSTRYVTSFSGCRPPATQLTLPPTSGTVSFCASSSGVLRFVTHPSLCLAGETPLQATPNDAAPALSSSFPATGATNVGTTSTVVLSFSEVVTAPPGAFAFTCGAAPGTPVDIALSGSPGPQLTLTPMAARVRATDSGSPGLTFDKAFTITVIDVNDAPVANPDAHTGAVGNTMFALNLPLTPTPRVAATGSVLTANDVDEDGDSLSTVAATVTSTEGGTATIDAAGNFTFLPGVGDKGLTDRFQYTVTDGKGGQSTSTVSVAIGTMLVWWVDNASRVAPADGRSTAPLTGLTTLNGLGGAGDVTGADERRRQRCRPRERHDRLRYRHRGCFG